MIYYYAIHTTTKIILVQILTELIHATNNTGRLRGLTDSALDHGSLPPEVVSRREHI